MSAIWLGKTPTGAELERMPLPWFHQAIDALLAETVPRSYWIRAIEGRAREGR